MTVEINSSIQVVLADDHPIPMEGFSTTLAKYGIKVIGQAKTPVEAETLYSDLKPDVLIMDLRFGEKLSGLDAAKRVLQKFPDAAIVFLSQFDIDRIIKESYQIGGYAFITKTCGPAELAAAVTHAHQGQRYFLPQIAERLANLSLVGDNSPQALLDERELEAFLLIAKGFTIAEMAETLAVSQKTISNLTHTIKVKLGVARSADITLLAVKYGHIDVDNRSDTNK